MHPGSRTPIFLATIRFETAPTRNDVDVADPLRKAGRFEDADLVAHKEEMSLNAIR